MESFKHVSNRDAFVGEVKEVYRKENRFFFTTEVTTFSIEVLSEKILRFRYAYYHDFDKDFSYAIDPKFASKDTSIDFSENEQQATISTKFIQCHISKSTGSKVITNHKGEIILQDEKGYHWQDEAATGGSVFVNTFKIQGGESFYGLGDKPCDLNLRGKRFQLWGSDTYAYGKDTDPVYKNIPFYIGLHHKKAYGVFFDNTFKTFFDFGKGRESVTSMWAMGGEMNFYFVYGPEITEVCENYADLTGKASLPPKWALGFQQSKWSYYPEKTVRELADEFRNREIPCDVIHLDIDYMDGYRCFTWDNERFPNPTQLIADLEKQGFKTVVIIDPGIKVDPGYWVYDQGKENDYFCRAADGKLYRGSVWPGPCYFPDFTNPEVRTWWEGLFDGLVKEGVAGVWNDMNEPAVFEHGTFPSSIRHDYDGNDCSHRKAHNVYGMQMVRATHDGLQKLNKDKRPFAITRSAYAGTQRYAAMWTGDNVASWDHLKIAVRQCQRLSMSGISFVGSDIGGFIETPDGELFTRWIQAAMFHPFFRAHSSGDHGDKEPWKFGEKYTKIIKRFISLRYQFIPYLYTAFYQHSINGAPILKSLAMIDQYDPETYYRKAEFGIGENLLTCPVDQPQVDGRWVYLPKGKWFNFWTNELYIDAEEIWIEAKLDSLPLFVKAGTVLPMGEAMEWVDQKKTDKLSLLCYFNTDETVSHLYDDQGDGYGYQSTVYSLKKFTLKGDRKQGLVSLTQEKEGEYQSEYKYYALQLIGIPFSVTTALIDGESVNFEYDANSQLYTLEVSEAFETIELS